MKVGFIGLGGMGKYMAANVLKAGFELEVYDIRESAMHEFKELGAASGDSPGEVAAASDLVLASLPSIAASEKMALSENGVLALDLAGELSIPCR